MEEGKSVVVQVREFQNIVYEVQSKGMDLPQQFVMGSGIHELPPSLKDYGIPLKYKRNEMRMENFFFFFFNPRTTL